MSNKTVKPYSEDEEKKSQVERMFNKIAPVYDFMNHFLSLGIDKRWRKKALSTLKNRDLDHILDIATGTGDLAIAANKMLDINQITALDLSQSMLDIGQKKIEKKNLQDKIKFIKGDSENLPFENNSFDAVIVAFGVRNFQNLDKGLKEMQRVLKTGGKMVVLEFTKPKNFVFKFGFNAYFKYVLPLIGRFTSKDPKAYTYLYESVQAFPDYEEFITHLDKAGLKNNTCESLSFGICAVYTGIK